MKTIARHQDVIHRKADLEHLHTFRKFPVFMGCTSAPRTEDIHTDMNFWISRGSGMIQLDPILPLDILYPEAHGSGNVGRSWSVHHEALAHFIAKYSASSVLEIGGAHGMLAKAYQVCRHIPWTIVEPNPTPVEGCRATFIKGFFDESFVPPHAVDMVVHSHVFEHMYDPAKFVSQLASFLAIGQKLVFSVPNMRAMVDRQYTNCLNFEHTVFLTEEYIEFLLMEHGFHLLERQYFLDDHSIFYATEKREQTAPSPLPSGLYEKNGDAYRRYVDTHEQLVRNINAEIRGKHNVYLFGAHAQAQYLIGFGLDTEPIVAVLDNDRSKQGKRLYGTDKIVFAPQVLAEKQDPTVIVRAGTFTKEVVEQMTGLNPSTRFLL